MPAKILIIDDSRLFIRAITICLREAGFVVASAGTGEEGLQVAREHKPAIVLLDMFLPRLDGMMVLRMLHGDPETRGTPILVISANDNDADILAAKRLGVVGYINKSRMNAEELVATIKKALSTTAQTECASAQPASATSPVA